MTNLSFWQRIAILIGLLIVGLLALLALDPIPQDPNYHLFADTRSLFGIPHFNNVISNARAPGSGLAVKHLRSGRRELSPVRSPPAAMPPCRAASGRA
jgi:hypothetical protein